MELRFDYSDGDYCFDMGGNMMMDSDGNLMQDIGGGVAMDMESGEMHIVESNSSFGRRLKLHMFTVGYGCARLFLPEGSDFLEQIALRVGAFLYAFLHSRGSLQSTYERLLEMVY